MATGHPTRRHFPARLESLESVTHFWTIGPGLCYAEGMARKAYPSDVSDDEWAFAAPYLSLMTEEAPQREYSLREVFNGLRWIIRAGAPWRLMPHDLPPWYTVYQQTQRW